LVDNYTLYVPLHEVNNIALIVYAKNYFLIWTVNLPKGVKAKIDGSYNDGAYLYVWGAFGVARI